MAGWKEAVLAGAAWAAAASFERDRSSRSDLSSQGSVDFRVESDTDQVQICQAGRLPARLLPDDS